MKRGQMKWKNGRRVMAVLLSLVLILSSAGVTAFAEESTDAAAGLTFGEEENTQDAFSEDIFASNAGDSDTEVGDTGTDFFPEEDAQQSGELLSDEEQQGEPSEIIDEEAPVDQDLSTDGSEGTTEGAAGTSAEEFSEQDETAAETTVETPAEELSGQEGTAGEAAETPAEELSGQEGTAGEAAEIPAEEISEQEEAAAETTVETPAEELRGREDTAGEAAEIPAEDAFEQGEAAAETTVETPAEELRGQEDTDGEAAETSAEAVSEQEETTRENRVQLPSEESTGEDLAEGETAGAEQAAFDQSMTVDGMMVTVKAEPGVFPEDAVLSVGQVPVYQQTQADAAVEEVRGEDQNVAVSYTFDIKVINPETGEEYQPAEGQTVNVSFALAEVADENLTANVYHVTEEETTGEMAAEALDVTTEVTPETGEETTVTVETDGFSIYTVEFTYNTLEYVMQGDTAVALSEILQEVGLAGEVTDVAVSNADLFSASNETGEWIVTAHQAFDTTEWMTVTIGGVTYEITVTDDGEITTWGQLQTALDAGGTVTLTRNLTAGSGDTMLQVSGTVTLDLNGCTLNRNRTTTDADGHVIIVNAGGNLTIKDSSYSQDGTITGGWANNGGGINNKGTLTIEGGSITGNHVSGTDNSGRGAGIWNNGTLVMTGGTISDNSGDDAGGIYNAAGGTVTLDDVTITGNASTHHGGGGLVNYGTATLTKCTVSKNTALSNGGGIWTNNTVSLTGCTLSENSSSGSGGGLFVSAGTVTLSDYSIYGNDYSCDIDNNTAKDGGAVYISAGTTVSCSGEISITSNDATVNGGGGITNYGTFATAGRLNVTGNTSAGNGGGLWNNGVVRAEGTVAVKDNYSGVSPNNLYLKSGKVITLTGALGSASGIYISGENIVGNVTSGWSSSNQTATAGDIFKSDDGAFTAVIRNSEVSFTVSFIRRSWNGNAVVSEEGTIPDDATVTIYNGQEELARAWVIVNRTQTLDDRLGINGSVHLILMDGVTLTVKEGVRVAQGHTLTIYGQSGDPEDSGRLVATGRQYTAGIGSDDQDASGNPDSAGTIIIHGGNIDATGGEDGAGIGGGNEAHGGTVTIYGGTVKATGGANGAGIGGGDEGNGGSTTIYGGTVTAKGCYDSFYSSGPGAGIGGGTGGNGGTITINGGTVNASAEMKGAGIGCGAGSKDIGSITINGGTVTATGGGTPDEGGAGGAGIGGAFDTSIEKGTVTINGGTVTAQGGYYSAGIGGGQGDNFSADILITNGDVTAIGGVTETRGNGAAGIGGGTYYAGGGDFRGTLTISGGTVRAYGGYSKSTGGAGIGGGFDGNMTGTINISGGTVIAEARHGGAAIGTGEKGSCTGTVNITGGTLKLKTVDNSLSGEASPANVIGHGASYSDNNAQNGTLKLPDGYAVWLEDQTPALAANRKALCQSAHESVYLYIEPCTHSDATYTCTETTHTLNCSYCLDHTESAHTCVADGKCTVCGYQSAVFTVNFDANGGSAVDAQTVVTGQKATEPEAPTRDGYAFRGWYQVTGTDPETLAENTFDFENTAITADITLKAKWEELPVVTINGVSGSFNDRIKLNYYFNIPEAVLADQAAYVDLTNDNTGKTSRVLIKDAAKDADKGYKFSFHLAAREAGDTITARAYDGQDNALTIKGNLRDNDYTETGVQYNLMKYFTWLEANGEGNEKAVGSAAKDYCAAAQIYFNYNAEGLSVSSAVDAVTAETLSSYIAGRTGTLPAGVSIRGISAMLESDNTLRLYLGFTEVDPSGFTYAIDDNPVDLKQRTDGSYYLAMDAGVWSNRLQSSHTYSVSDGTNSYTITASVLTYARSCAIKSNDKESNLGKALYLYNRAAVNAFGE